ncbi:MAG: alpha-galactosidase [Marinoscillum sp.]
MKMHKKSLINIALLIGLASACTQKHEIISGDLSMEVSEEMYTSISSVESGALLTNLQSTEYLITGDGNLSNYHLFSSSQETIGIPGVGTQYTFKGENKTKGIVKILKLVILDDHPDLILTHVTYINQSQKDLSVKAWMNNGYNILSNDSEPPFWAFQGSSSGERLDWIKPVKQGYYQKNYLGMNSSDYGGGIPVTDVWTSDYGITVGHTEVTPKLVSLPTEMKKYQSNVQVGVQQDFERPFYLRAGDTLETLQTFVAIHQGDYYNGLQKFAMLMKTKGIKMPASEPAAYEPIWCAWGYERDFTLDEVKGTLPKIKELGIKWAVLDDGFQQAEGDWHTNQNKFPQGDNQIKSLVKSIHDQGLKAKIWWAPLAADPGSNLLAQNPKMRLYLEDWSPQYITWWDAYYLSPTHPKTLTHTKEMVNLFLNEWDFDGLKMDGQHMNAVAPDHNPESGLDDPDLAPELLPQFFKAIYEEARSIKPNAVVENCPCGTCMSFYNMPFMNQAVSSDPLSSWQIRHKGKTYKALIPNTAYYGDHVELSDESQDFASSFGIGAVLGTKFTWPKDNPAASNSYLLTPEKEEVWKTWFSLYNDKMLSQGEYLGGLYDIGYDRPETHVILKKDTLYYAFYDEQFSGQVEFRGLSEPGTYIVNDYVNDIIIGEISLTKPQLTINFEKSVLVEVYPK